MIERALYQTVNPILKAYPLEALAQETDSSTGLLKGVKPPLAIYSESYQPLFTKDAIAYYQGTLFVSIVAKTKLEVRDYSLQMIEVLKNISGTTVDGTEFLHVRQANELAIDYDPEDQAFYSELSFNFKSKNL